MNRCHIYIDGTWLFKQCGGILAQKTFNKNFFLDLGKLNQTVSRILSNIGSAQTLTLGGLWYYTSIFRNIPDYDKNGNSLAQMKQTSLAKDHVVDSAKKAGYDTSGAFDVPLQHWMPKRVREKTYQEKMVDTALVARMVQSCLEFSNDYHVLVSGDLDMMPAVSLVVPNYLEKVVLLTTHPDQWDPNMQQTSRKLNDFHFKLGPFYLEDYAVEIMMGEYTYKCSNPGCNKLFSLPRPIPNGQRPFCIDCRQNRPSRRYT